MREVISFELKGGINKVLLPTNYKIIKMTLKKFQKRGFGADHIIRDQEEIALIGWAIVADAATGAQTHTERTVIVVGTKKPVPPTAEYIDSIMFEDERLAMHLFEIV